MWDLKKNGSRFQGAPANYHLFNYNVQQMSEKA